MLQSRRTPHADSFRCRRRRCADSRRAKRPRRLRGAGLPRSHPASPLTFTRSHRFFRCSSHRLRDADAGHLEKLTPPHITWESSFTVARELQMLTRAVFPLNVPAEERKKNCECGHRWVKHASVPCLQPPKPPSSQLRS